ncbi:MAG: hypothetical protein H0U00_03320, partial [Actinobacteria bacterium]|nr:hypothetical protein [Actinomycetota bacterium]
PLPVLELDGAGRHVYALDPAATFSYEYRQSIYDVPVEEHFRLEGGRLRLERARSPHPAALEYFRWPGEVRPDGAWLSIEAPGVVEEELVIRVAAAGQQRLRTRPGYVVSLGGLRSELVRLRGSTRPLVVWLPHRLQQID